MIKINILKKDQFLNYIDRALLTADGIDIYGKLTDICSSNTLLLKALKNNVSIGLDWVVLNENDIRYIGKVSFPDLPNQTDFNDNAFEIKGFDFILVVMNNDDIFLCPMSELTKFSFLV